MNTRRRKIKLSLAFILFLVVFAFAALLFTNWLLFGNNPAESTFLHAVRGIYQQYMDYLLGDNPAQNRVIQYSVPFILFFMTISLLSIVILFILLIIRRTSKLKQETIDQIQLNKIQNLIIDYLFSENPNVINQLKLEPKGKVIDQLVILYNSNIGNKATLTKKLFYALNLDEFVINKILSWFWDVRVKYMYIAASMDVVSAIDVVKKNINTHNWNVRNAAQLALLTLDKSHSFYFLHKLHRPLSNWQQVNLHHTIVRESIPAPNFGDFILSQNNSVVNFGLSMIEAFNQKEEAERIIRLLHHKDSEIKHKALHTIKALVLKDAAPLLINKYPNENTHIQLDIVEALARFDTDESVAFLGKLFPTNNFETNLAIIKNTPSASIKKVIGNTPITPEIEKMLKFVAIK